MSNPGTRFSSGPHNTGKTEAWITISENASSGGGHHHCFQIKMYPLLCQMVEGLGAYLGAQPECWEPSGAGRQREKPLLQGGMAHTKTSPSLAFLTDCSRQVLVLPGSDSSHVETPTYVFCACCGTCFKALKSSHALFREPGHKARIMKCFSPESLGYCDLIFFPTHGRVKSYNFLVEILLQLKIYFKFLMSPSSYSLWKPKSSSATLKRIDKPPNTAPLETPSALHGAERCICREYRANTHVLHGL